MRFLTIGSLLAAAAPALSCDSCYGPRDDTAHVRNVPRMQPDALNATSVPRGPLAWGQLNFIHTTDTHGWLEGHIKEQNYGADWGDYVSFVKHMRAKAEELGVDLLVVDTGDLHDGAGLSDAESPDGVLSNPVFENINYDLLTIGNHELYITDIAELTAGQFAHHYGDKYITSNVKIFNNELGQYEFPGQPFRYFTTPHGIRIMTFGILYDFTGNSNASQVTLAADLVQEQWFADAVNIDKPVDLFLVLGHNPVRASVSSSTMGTIFNFIRERRPNTPIQVLGGHTHIRDFTVYDEGATGLESGRYCETLGWLSMSGIQSSTFKGTMTPKGVPNPTQKPIPTSGATPLIRSTPSVSPAFKDLVYFRRYLDWNRVTFAFHAEGSQSKTFDTGHGLEVTSEITALRNELNLTTLFGCAPQTYCVFCAPFLGNGSIFTLLQTALATTVINESRADIPRLIIINTGSVRFDLVEGPFTFDDSFIVSPFTDTFQFIPEVPYSLASQVLGLLDSGPIEKRRRNLETRDFGFSPIVDTCVDAVTGSTEDRAGLVRRTAPLTRGKHRRQTTSLTPGYTTSDDFGTDGDDTIHSAIPFFNIPNDLQANASFPADGSTPEAVDLIFLDFIGEFVLPALSMVGGNYTTADILQYLPVNFTTNSYLPEYAKMEWQANVPNCPIGLGILG